jgi:hypothetical protein
MSNNPRQFRDPIILQVFSEIRKSGAERMLHSAIKARPKLASRILIIGFGENHPYASELSNLGMKFMSMEGNAKSLFALINYAKYLRTNNPDVIHIHIEQAFILLVCIARIVNPRSTIVRTIHGDHRQSGYLYVRRRVMMNLAIRLFRVRWIACSSYIASIETKTYGSKIDFVENWASVENPNNEKVLELDAAIDLNFGSRKRLLLIGNCDRNKNHLEILSNESVLEKYLVIHIGSTHGAEAEEIRLLSDPRIITLDVEPSIGYELCDAVVVPSIKEAMSVVVLESLVRGKEVLVTREWGSWWTSNFDSAPSEIIPGYWALKEQKNLKSLRYRFSPMRGITQYAQVYSGKR